MAVQLLAVIALIILSTATVNGQTGDLLPAPVLTGDAARALELDQNPELLALAARSFTRVLVVITRAQQTTLLTEGVNANIDCLPWIFNVSGGTTEWLFRVRNVFGEFTSKFT